MAEFPTYEEMAKNVAEKALDEFLYDGKSIREWMQIIASEDYISRQAVLDTLDTSDKFMDEDRTVETYKALLKECYEVLPPVTQKPKMGQWIFTQRDRYIEISCSECGNTRFKDYTCGYTIDEINDLLAKFHLNFCECCGAKMVEEQERSE